MLSAWLFVGKFVTDGKEGVRVHVCEKGADRRDRAEVWDVVF